MENAIGNVTTVEVRDVYSFVGLTCIGLIGVILVLINFCWRRYQKVCKETLDGERGEWVRKYHILIISINLVALAIVGLSYKGRGLGIWDNSFAIVGYSWAGGYILEMVLLRYILPWTNKRRGKYFPNVSSERLIKTQLSIGSCIFLAASLTLTAVALVLITNEALTPNAGQGVTASFSLSKEGLSNGVNLFLAAILWLVMDYMWEYWSST